MGVAVVVSEEADVLEEASEDDSEDQGDLIHLEGVSRYGISPKEL